MPLYEYRCRSCGRVTEKIQSFSAEPLKVCESCGGELERLVSAPAIQFKGSGWYVTDYSRKSAQPGSSGSKSDSDAGKSDAATSESADKKPAADAKPTSSPTPSTTEKK